MEPSPSGAWGACRDYIVIPVIFEQTLLGRAYTGSSPLERRHLRVEGHHGQLDRDRMRLAELHVGRALPDHGRLDGRDEHRLQPAGPDGHDPDGGEWGCVRLYV